MKIKTYEALQAKRAELDEHLARVPAGLDLVDADAGDLAVLGDMFTVLDGPGVWGAKGTVLAKVLHRKRPRFVPSTTSKSASSTKLARTRPCHRHQGVPGGLGGISSSSTPRPSRRTCAERRTFGRR